VNAARSLQFPLPLSSTAEQLWIWGSAQGYGGEDDAGLVRCFLPCRPEAVKECAGRDRKTESIQNGTLQNISKLAFIGLGAMGQGAAASLLRGGYVVAGYDMSPTAVEKFASQSKKAIAAPNPAEAAKGADVVFLMVQNAAQVDDVLFGSGNVAEELSDGTTVVINSTVPPYFIRSLERRLEALNKRIDVVDAPVSGGAGRAADGTLAVSKP
jgi:3-hydroxyisobutyrate dehydrogenase-like beta-hydroxyacid dehydrogenase